jgi:hypothetical protein
VSAEVETLDKAIGILKAIEYPSDITEAHQGVLSRAAAGISLLDAMENRPKLAGVEIPRTLLIDTQFGPVLRLAAAIIAAYEPEKE